VQIYSQLAVCERLENTGQFTPPWLPFEHSIMYIEPAELSRPMKSSDVKESRQPETMTEKRDRR
jgi:hypothetical protein